MHVVTVYQTVPILGEVFSFLMCFFIFPTSKPTNHQKRLGFAWNRQKMYRPGQISQSRECLRGKASTIILEAGSPF